MKTRNEDNLQMEDDVLEKYSTHVDKRNAEDDWSMLKNEDTQKTIVLCQKLDEVTTTSSDKVSVDGEGKPEVKEEENLKLEPEARINVSKASHEKEKGISFTASKLCNDCDETQENNMIVPSASECDENKKITEAEDEDGTHRKQVNKQNHISTWHMISQHVLSDVVPKVGSDQLLEGTDDEENRYAHNALTQEYMINENVTNHLSDIRFLPVYIQLIHPIPYLIKQAKCKMVILTKFWIVTKKVQC
ncbi:hypothetical protein K7X08_037405 [Anisodus acutangulus]|uniref:Uncharacterized protein n=1 Tax=Anisodus acutangulus TaxID=402998 RepID=A0A9Q1RSK0_9SOLA|nr:hypothetical protein K7X08_037405 [Anisodus acutangulus]